jgi:putative transposase
MINRDHPNLSIIRQCQLISLCHSSYYYREQRNEIWLSLDYLLSRRIDQLYLQYPFYGSRRMTASLKLEGFEVNRKRICRLMREMGLHAIYPRKKLSNGNPEHRIYPYLLRRVKVERVNQVWATDITYIPMRKGFLFLVAIMDWYSRYVLSWELSPTQEKYFCIRALERAFCHGEPEIFNSDQGSQFTSPSFLQLLLDRGIAISMDGRGRVFDNIFIERLWRSVKHEEVYLKEYQSLIEAEDELSRYFDFYNNIRPHQSLGYRSPQEIFRQEVRKK